ncbi:DUF4249 domain-containing protein [Spirosoma areae]
MRLVKLAIHCLIFSTVLTGCVDPYDPAFDSTVDVVVVDGTITDLDEPQTIRLNRSKADRFTGRFGNIPLTGATVEVIVDGVETVKARETNSGTYQLPDGFRGRVGGRYRLHFQLSDGMGYESSEETMPAVPPIERITDQYNPRSLDALGDGLRAANDLYVETNDPAGTPNYYRWDWVLWERQDFCRTCPQNFVYVERDATNTLVEGCVFNNRIAPLPFPPPLSIDYECRTKCWEILFSAQLNQFADTYSDGKIIANRRVGQIPFYQYSPALVEVRQSALTLAAHTYIKRLAEQSQRTGGLTDTPPSAPIGNIRNVTDDRENVVGYFTASGVSAVRYWLDRKNVTNELPAAPGDTERPKLFTYLNGRSAFKEPVAGVRGRPPLAVCVPSDSRTPFQPQGWRD